MHKVSMIACSRRHCVSHFLFTAKDQKALSCQFSSHPCAHRPQPSPGTVEEGGGGLPLFFNRTTEPHYGPLRKSRRFPNLSLNKLACWRAADRPFIVAGAGPMASADRAASLWFPVQAPVINEIRRERRQKIASPHKSSPRWPPFKPHFHLHGPGGDSGEVVKQDAHC